MCSNVKYSAHSWCFICCAASSRFACSCEHSLAQLSSGIECRESGQHLLLRMCTIKSNACPASVCSVDESDEPNRTVGMSPRPMSHNRYVSQTQVEWQPTSDLMELQLRTPLSIVVEDQGRRRLARICEPTKQRIRNAQSQAVALSERGMNINCKMRDKGSRGSSPTSRAKRLCFDV